MRVLFLVIGFLCCFVGIEFLVVDQVVLHEWSFRPGQSDDPGPEVQGGAGRAVDLPDLGGYVLVAAGVVCLMYYFAIGHRKERT